MRALRVPRLKEEPELRTREVCCVTEIWGQEDEGEFELREGQCGQGLSPE